MRIATTDYWSIISLAEWREALDANAFEECIFSDAVPGREQLRGEYEGPGTYHICRFCDNPCEYGVVSSLLCDQELWELLDNAHALLRWHEGLAAPLWRQAGEEGEE